MEENIANAFEGGLSMGMNFASKGLCWAGNIYQKWESMCQNNIMVQEPSKLIDAVGEQVRKIYEEVADDLLNPFSLGCVKLPISGLPSEQDIIPDVCEKSRTSHDALEKDVAPDVCERSRTSHDEVPINEASLIYTSPTLTISSEEILQDERKDEESVCPMPDLQQDGWKEACDVLNKEIALASAEDAQCSCFCETRDEHGKVSKSSPLTNHSNSLPSDGVSLFEFPGNTVEKEFMLSCFTAPTNEDGNSQSPEAITFSQSFSTVSEERSSLSEQEASPSTMDIGNSDCFGKQKPEYSVGVDKRIQINEEFEDVSLEDCFVEKKQEGCWEEAESYELALISYRAMKNRSYKKKIKDAFTSRFYSLKKNNEPKASFFGVADADLTRGGITASSPVSSRILEANNSTPESCESDWELL